jgi:hypothetical protein
MYEEEVHLFYHPRVRQWYTSTILVILSELWWRYEGREAEADAMLLVKMSLRSGHWRTERRLLRDGLGRK